MRLSKYRLGDIMRADAITKILLTLVALGLFLNVISTSNANDCATRIDLNNAVADIKNTIVIWSP